MKTERVYTDGQTRRAGRSLEPWLWGLLFLGVFLYIWKGIEPHLLYYGFGVFAPYPAFPLEGSFFRTTFSTAGGAVNALAALLAQTYRVSWLGALVVTAILGAFIVGIRRLLRSAQAEKFGDLAWFPVLLVLPIYSYYYEDPLPLLLAVTLAVWAAVFYGTLSLQISPRRIGAFLCLFAVIYYLAGASAFVFAAVVCFTEALLHRRVVPALVQAALAVVWVLATGRLIFDLGPRAAYTAGTPWAPDNLFKLSPLANWLAHVLYTWAPVVIALALVSRILLEIDARKGAPANRGKKRSQRVKSSQIDRWRADPRVLTGLRIALVTVVTVSCLTIARTYKHDERALHYYARGCDWDAVLALADRMRGTNSFTRCGVFDINRALAHQGRLGSELFAFPQEGTGMLFMDFQGMSGRLKKAKSLDLYLDLGCLNAAQRNAYELLDLMGPSPHVLEALIKIHLAKGQDEAARVVLEALRKYVGSREYVRRWQSLVADPARAESDPLIQSYRKAGLIQDDTSIEVSMRTLERQSVDDPDHRLAFEYLMAGYLLRHERVELINHLPLLKSLGYQQLPRHYAEALLVDSLATGTPLDTQGWTMDPDLQRQFQEIRSTAARAGGNAQAAFDTLAPKYGDTYMFYSMFDRCGLK